MKRRFVFVAVAVVALAACSSGGDRAGPSRDRRSEPLASTTSQPEATSPTVTVSTPSGPRAVPTPDQAMSDEEWARSLGIPLERQADLDGQPVWLDSRNHRVVIPSCAVATTAIEAGARYAGYAYLCRA